MRRPSDRAAVVVLDPQRCRSHPHCELVNGHDGGCDARPEAVRFRQLLALVDSGAVDDEILRAIERSARRSIANR